MTIYIAILMMEISIKALADLLAELTGFEGKIIWDTDKPNGQPRRNLNTQRAKDYFSFEAEMLFKEDLGRTIEWYLANKEGIE